MERNKGFVKPMKRAIAAEETICQLRPVGVFAVLTPFTFPGLHLQLPTMRFYNIITQ